MPNWYDDGVNLIAFSRGDRAWIAINNEADGEDAHVRDRAARRAATATSSTATASTAACPGSGVVVDGHGNATITVGAQDAVAIDGRARGAHGVVASRVRLKRR